MKVLVQRSFVVAIARREPLTFGNWARSKSIAGKAPVCVGCLVGTMFLKVSGQHRKDDISTSALTCTIYKALYIEEGRTNDYHAVARGLEDKRFNPELVAEGLKLKMYNSVLSHIFESSRHEAKTMKLCRVWVIKQIDKYLPEQFELEVDGLKLADKLPHGVSFIQK